MTEDAREVEVRGAVAELVATVKGTVVLGDFSPAEAEAIWAQVRAGVEPWLRAQQRGSM